MTSSAKSASRKSLLEQACEQLPNCTKALHLADTGAQRPLSWSESVALRYHGRLCPFCGCAAGKFQSALRKMKEAEQDRTS